MRWSIKLYGMFRYGGFFLIIFIIYTLVRLTNSLVWLLLFSYVIILILTILIAVVTLYQRVKLVFNNHPLSNFNCLLDFSGEIVFFETTLRVENLIVKFIL